MSNNHRCRQQGRAAQREIHPAITRLQVKDLLWKQAGLPTVAKKACEHTQDPPRENGGTDRAFKTFPTVIYTSCGNHVGMTCLERLAFVTARKPKSDVTQHESPAMLVCNPQAVSNLPQVDFRWIFSPKPKSTITPDRARPGNSVSPSLNSSDVTLLFRHSVSTTNKTRLYPKRPTTCRDLLRFALPRNISQGVQLSILSDRADRRCIASRG